MNILIRELKVEDAVISWKWRNDPEVWKLTGRKWNNHVTKEIEEAWIQKVRQEKDSKRFAICIGEKGEYVGNIQLTGITDIDAELHLFIGEKQYWGKGIGQKATAAVVKFAFEVLKLEAIYLYVKKENIAAVKAYEKNGFIPEPLTNNELKMIVRNRSTQ